MRATTISTPTTASSTGAHHLTAVTALDPPRPLSPAHLPDDVDELIVNHLGLADAIARRFAHRGEDEDDLRQVARTGLVEAAHRFEPDRGEFPPFAVATVTGAIKREFRDHGWLVRPPRRTQELVVSMGRTWNELAQTLGSEPTTGDLADALGVDTAQVRRARCASQGYHATPSEEAERADPRGQDDDYDRLEAALLVDRLLAGLDDDDRLLLHLRFVEERTQSDIAARLHCSQMQVSRLLSRLLSRLRDEVADPAAA